MFNRILNTSLLLTDFGTEKTGPCPWTLHAQALNDQEGDKFESGATEFIDRREQYHLFFWPMQDIQELPSTKVLYQCNRKLTCSRP